MARIYQTSNMGEATLRVALVGNQGEADLLVHRVGSWGSARGDALWYITRDRQDATALLYFTSVGMAQIKICFVDSYASAGWQERGQDALRYRGRLG